MEQRSNGPAGSVSRWESGTHEPEPGHRRRIAELIAARTGNDFDAALTRLVTTSAMPVHLICDATHILLAASPSRASALAGGIDAHVGKSLWKFATPEIAAAEAALADRSWFERPFQTLSFHTGGNNSDEVPVRPSVVRWETLPLADGLVGRLTTTLSLRE